MAGEVTVGRYRELVEQARRLVDEASRAQFRIGDIALEIAPMQARGGTHPAFEVSDLADYLGEGR